MAAPIRHVKEFKRLLRKCSFVRKSLSETKEFQTTCQVRFHHILSSKVNQGRYAVLWKTKKPELCAVFFQSQRLNSTDNTVNTPLTELPVDYIPEPPLPPPESVHLSETLNALGEPTFASLGLNHYTPSGVVQMALETLHVNLDLPWWGAIAIATVCVRLLIFPLVIIARRNIINMGNHMPTLQRMQEKMTEARNAGNRIKTAEYALEMRDYMVRNDVSVWKNILVPAAQFPIFLSWFIGLRQMVNLPVESLQTGGLFWFTDLTVSDPYFLLPVVTMATLSLTIEIGADGMAASQQSHGMKWMMRAFPVIGLVFVSNFPTALCCYWFTSNAFSLVQVLFLKIPAVQKFFNIPTPVVHPPHLSKKKGFIQGFKENWENSKVTGAVQDRMRADAMDFKKAGEGPIPKTFPYDPAKVERIAKGIKAKAKS